MIILAALVAGALTGAAIARKRGGKLTDLLHYAAVYGIGFTLLGVVLTIALGRMV